MSLATVITVVVLVCAVLVAVGVFPLTAVTVGLLVAGVCVALLVP